jgi:voltage-gated potassium channel
MEFETRRPKSDFWVRTYTRLRTANNVLLLPLFTIMFLEIVTGNRLETIAGGRANLFFCASFLIEWALGLTIARSRRAFLLSPSKIIDLVSSIPVGHIFQSLRAVRLVHLARILRLAARARRFRGKGESLVRALGVIFATVFSGAFAMQLVEPSPDRTVLDNLWWSIVTLSTVGYGDFVPQSTAGRAVASILIIVGVGVFGYAAGFVASLLNDPEEDELLARLTRLESKLDRLQETLASVPEGGLGVGDEK